ncbi:MAG: ubiquinol-cytochrome c reductase iron-sulfur subunit [Candidatus Dormibacteria bacterium]
MSRADRRLQRYVDAILGDRRPRRGPAGADSDAMRLAATLHAAHPGAADPAPAFVDDLARRLRHGVAEERVPLPQRRRFLAAAGAAAAAGIGVGFGIDHWRSGVSSTPPATTLNPSEGRWVPVATMSEMGMGTVRRFSANGVEGFVLNTGGKVSALSAACTDQGCILQVDSSGKQLNCPCHYAQFNLDGTPKPGAYHPVTPLPVIQVRANGDTVEALLPAVRPDAGSSG